MGLIKIANLPKSRNNNVYATTLTGERFGFASKDLADKAVVGNYAWAIEVISDKTYKRKENGEVELDPQGKAVLINREGGPQKFMQITQVFTNQAEAFRAKNEAKLEAVAERVFLKKEIQALGLQDGMEENEIADITASLVG